ncbi:MAG: hypothetical protein M3O50_05595 [Myxococcota bacterium]|nr:hypothetical protein [Myxococcota bacterium]
MRAPDRIAEAKPATELARRPRRYGHRDRTTIVALARVLGVRVVTTMASAALSALACSACGGRAASPQAPAATSTRRVDVAASAPDLSAVADPAGLVASGRFARPGAMLAAMSAWSKRPMPESQQLTELLTGEALGPLVDMDAPVDFAVVAIGTGSRMRDLAAISLAIKDPVAARAAILEHHKLAPAANGAIVIEGLGRPGGGGEAAGERDEGGRSCELAPAFGPALLRLVCGKSSDALAQLGPWLTRTAVRAEAASDIHVDVRMPPVRETLLAQKRLFAMVLASMMAERGGLSAARPVASSMASDLVDFALDLDSVTLDVALGPAGEASATAALRLTGITSTLGHVATAHPERAGPPPAVFWQLPVDAYMAFFSRGVDDSDVARVRDVVGRVIADKLSALGLAAAEREPIVDAVGKLISAAPMSYAGGVDQDAVGKAGAAEGAGARGAAVEALFGWHLLAIDEPAARFAGAMNELALAWSRRTVAAAHGNSQEAVPSLRAAPVAKGSASLAGASHYVLDLPVVDPDPGGSPSGGKANVTNTAGRRKLMPIHLLVVPDGARTWLGVAGDEARLAAKLAGAMSGTGATLASRADVAALKDGAVGFGGFVMPQGLLGAAQPMAGPSGRPMPGGGAAPVGASSQVPRQGGDAVLFSCSAQAVPPGRQAVAKVRLPRAAIEDLLATAMHLSL